MRYVILCVWICIFSVQGNGQSSVALTTVKDTFSIGEPIEITYKVNNPGGAQISSLDFTDIKEMENLAYPQDTLQFDEFMDASVIDGGVIGISDNNLTSTSMSGALPLEGKITLSIYSIGAAQLPEVKIAGQNMMPLQRKMILVLPPAGSTARDTLELIPIKPNIKEGIAWQDFLWILYALLGIIGLGIGGYYMRKYLGKAEEIEEVIIEEVKLPAHIIANEDLEKLLKAELWQSGDTKAYHTELTRIVRQYLEDRYETQALEMTTSQLNRELPQLGLDEGIIKRIIDILQISDIVKFAKGNAGPEINERFLKEAFAIVDETKKEVSETNI